jgi:hypothetical protein
LHMLDKSMSYLCLQFHPFNYYFPPFHKNFQLTEITFTEQFPQKNKRKLIIALLYESYDENECMLG